MPSFVRCFQMIFPCVFSAKTDRSQHQTAEKRSSWRGKFRLRRRPPAQATTKSDGVYHNADDVCRVVIRRKFTPDHPVLDKEAPNNSNERDTLTETPCFDPRNEMKIRDNTRPVVKRRNNRIRLRRMSLCCPTLPTVIDEVGEIEPTNEYLFLGTRTQKATNCEEVSDTRILNEESKQDQNIETKNYGGGDHAGCVFI